MNKFQIRIPKAFYALPDAMAVVESGQVVQFGEALFVDFGLFKGKFPPDSPKPMTPGIITSITILFLSADFSIKIPSKMLVEAKHIFVGDLSTWPRWSSINRFHVYRCRDPRRLLEVCDLGQEIAYCQWGRTLEIGPTTDRQTDLAMLAMAFG